MDSTLIAELIVHLGRTASGDGSANGLTAGQWAVLRYFARANRFSRTPSAFAAFHGTTRGTASQAIKSMIAAGYLRQARSQTDGRSFRLDLTDKARAIISANPRKALTEAADALPPGVRGRFSDILQHMLAHVASATGKPLFGTCENCAQFEGGDRCAQTLPVPLCRYLNEPLGEEDLRALCINFSPEDAP